MDQQQQSTPNYPGKIIARLFNITERRLQQLAREGIIPKAARGEYPLAGCIRGYIHYLQNVGVNAEGTIDPERLDPFKRRAFYQGELDKLKVAIERSQLIPSMEVEQMFAAAFKVVSEFFDTIPDILERDCGLTSQQVLAVEARCDTLREDLYKLVSKETVDARRTAKKGR